MINHDNSILHVVSEKKIFEISANQKLLWPLAAILDNRSEQKVTTIIFNDLLLRYYMEDGIENCPE
jgi:hypothetical protein